MRQCRVVAWVGWTTKRKPHGIEGTKSRILDAVCVTNSGRGMRHGFWAQMSARSARFAPRFGRWLEAFHWWESGLRVRLSLLNLFRPGFDWLWWFAECGPLQPPESIRLEKRFQLLGGRARLARLLAHSFLGTVALAAVRHEPLNKTSSTQRSVGELPGC
jgi:hypothetical protein